MSDQPLFKVHIHNPLSIEEQLIERAHQGKCAMTWQNPDGTWTTYWINLSYMEKLFIVDGFQRRISWEIDQANRSDD